MHTLIRRWWLVVLGTGMGTAVGAYVQLTPVQYRSEVLLASSLDYAAVSFESSISTVQTPELPFTAAAPHNQALADLVSTQLVEARVATTLARSLSPEERLP